LDVVAVSSVKINEAYYHDVLLSRQLLPAMCQVSGEFIFQQDRPQLTGREMINLLERETPAFISTDFSSLNNPDLNSVEYKVWDIMQQRVYQTKNSGCGQFEAVYVYD